MLMPVPGASLWVKVQLTAHVVPSMIRHFEDHHLRISSLINSSVGLLHGVQQSEGLLFWKYWASSSKRALNPSMFRVIDSTPAAVHCSL